MLTGRPAGTALGLPPAAAVDAAPLPAFARVMLVIGALYLAQSVVGGLTFHSLPAALRAQGVGLEVIGLVALLMLPWAVKFLWAPWVERWCRPPGAAERSRSLIAGGQVLTAAVLAAAAFLSPAGLPMALFGAFALTALLTATVDIATDAYAVRNLRAGARGWGSVAQVGGAYLGLALGGGLFLVLVAGFGWTVAMLAAAAAMLLAALPMALTRPAVAPAMPPAARPSLRQAFARPAVRWGLLIVLLFQAGIRLGQGITGPFLVDSGLSLATIGLLQGGAGTAVSLLGVLLGGLLASRLGARTALPLGLLAQLAVLALTAALALLPAPPVAALAVAILAKALVTAAGFVLLYTAMMGWSSLRQAGVDFTLFQCADALVAAGLGPLAGVLAASLGYGATFALGAAASLVALALVPPILARLAALPDRDAAAL